MSVRKIVGLLLVASIVLAFGASWGATPPSLSGGTAQNITVGPSSLRAAEGFAFDPIVKSGKFIIGDFFCVALGTNTKKVTISKCYLVLSTGATYLGPVKSGTNVALSTKIVTNVPAVNISCGSPYYNPHIQRPAIFPPSDSGSNRSRS